MFTQKASFCSSFVKYFLLGIIMSWEMNYTAGNWPHQQTHHITNNTNFNVGVGRGDLNIMVNAYRDYSSD